MARAAIRYAQAVLDIALANNNASDVNGDMELIASTVKNNTELATFLLNPVISAQVKENALNEIFASATTGTKRLFQLLTSNQRFEILPAIAEKYTALYDESRGVQNAIVTTAVPMSTELEAKVLEKIKEISSKKITIQNVVDPSIIGGFILRIGDTQYNASIENKIQRLKREFSN
ncbi:ATP synthase F1 subunit delta [Flavobacterium agricola]|uniref:ATP synthase subunit delta n=1 Tax=Flavobacterium agricola TaxID=2870839 RepID=A0ABY6M197_9FLAO|nr:ATP synthase F1 subunit delta [Flavobacterium agricola]UYW00891.1 ATP synthase F1 subunit delta [Flavobacterium agricola]